MGRGGASGQSGLTRTCANHAATPHPTRARAEVKLGRNTKIINSETTRHRVGRTARQFLRCSAFA